MRAFQRLRLLWLVNCHLLPRWLIKFVPVFCDAGQWGLQGVARPSPPNLITELSAFSGYSWYPETAGAATSDADAFRQGVRKSSAEDHDDQIVE